MSAGLIAVDACGGALLVVTLADVFVTIFNYDGFAFLTARLHRLFWTGLRITASVLPHRVRHEVLALGSAALLPATLLTWLVLETSAFAMMYLPGMASGSFKLADGLPGQIGTAYYFSAGDITSLTFGDVIARTGIYRALADAETVIGLATVGLAVTYVLAALDALASLNRLHGRVRRQAIEPNRPATIVARYFHGGQPEELSSLLQAFTEDLEEYDQGLRRYPVVFYVHTRRAQRSVPRIFGALGDLIELIRWGLPPDHPLTSHPYLLALADQYTTTLQRLQRSFTGASHDSATPPLPRDRFWAEYQAGAPDDLRVRAFRSLLEQAAENSGLDAGVCEPEARTYERYREWLPFHRRRHAFVDAVTVALGYEGSAVAQPGTKPSGSGPAALS
jgi:hypothetical protein